MDAGTFARRADATLDGLLEQLDALDLEEVDAELGDGKLVIEIEGGAPLIVSRQTAANQLWLAEPGGGWHFDPRGDAWVCDKRGITLAEALSRELTRALARPVALE